MFTGCRNTLFPVVQKRYIKSGNIKNISNNFCKYLIFLVPRAGVEPARPYERGILSPLF